MYDETLLLCGTIGDAATIVHAMDTSLLDIQSRNTTAYGQFFKFQ